MSFRGILSLAALVIALGLERFAYYGMRTFLAFSLRAQDVTTASLSTLYTLMIVLTVVGMGAAGASSFGIGPRLTALGAAVAAMLGYLVMTLGSIKGGALLAAFGGGMLRVCPIAAVAQTIEVEDGPGTTPSPRRFAIVTAFAAGTTILVNVASGASGALTGLLHDTGGARVASIVASAAMFVSALFAGLSYAISRMGRASKQAMPEIHAPYRAPPRPPAAASVTPRNPAFALLAVALVAGAYGIALAFAQPPYRELPISRIGMLHGISSAVSVVGAVLCVVVCIVAAVTRSSFPPLKAVGVAAIVLGLGTVPIVLAAESTLVLCAMGMGVVGLAEPFVYAPIAAYSALALRGRAAAFGVAIVSAAMLVASTLSSWLVVLGSGYKVLGVFVALCAIGFGVATTITARRVHRALFE